MKISELTLSEFKQCVEGEFNQILHVILFTESNIIPDKTREKVKKINRQKRHQSEISKQWTDQFLKSFKDFESDLEDLHEFVLRFVLNLK